MLRRLILGFLPLIIGCSPERKGYEPPHRRGPSYLEGTYDVKRRCGGLMPGWQNMLDLTPSTLYFKLRRDGQLIWYNGLPIQDLKLWYYINLTIESRPVRVGPYILQIDAGTPCSRVYSIRSQLNRLSVKANLLEVMSGETNVRTIEE